MFNKNEKTCHTTKFHQIKWTITIIQAKKHKCKISYPSLHRNTSSMIETNLWILGNRTIEPINTHPCFYKKKILNFTCKASRQFGKWVMEMISITKLASTKKKRLLFLNKCHKLGFVFVPPSLRLPYTPTYSPSKSSILWLGQLI